MIKESPISLVQLLEDKEQRSAHQEELLSRSLHKIPLVCFTLNISGPIKRNLLIDKLFQIGFYELSETFSDDIIYSDIVERPSGLEGYFSIRQPAHTIKEITMRIEKNAVAGRLYDIDVITPTGEKLTRSQFGMPPRKCFICDENAYVCGKTNAHTQKELNQKTYSMVKEAVSIHLAALAVSALNAEVLTTPKPGLVDKTNNGAHEDMTLPLFLQSSEALRPYFEGVALTAMHFEGSLPELFDSLRPLGQQAEKEMLTATKGVNTHKGAIFTLGLFCAATAYLYGKHIVPTADTVHMVCKELCKNIAADFVRMDTAQPATAGERLFVKYGIMGIRGQAAEGFPAVTKIAYPMLQKLTADGVRLNDCGVFLLLNLMTTVDDTNIINRSSLAVLRQLQNDISVFLSTGPSISKCLSFSGDMDKRLIEQHISPGGCADLLAATYFLLFVAQFGNNPQDTN